MLIQIRTNETIFLKFSECILQLNFHDILYKMVIISDQNNHKKGT